MSIDFGGSLKTESRKTGQSELSRRDFISNSKEQTFSHVERKGWEGGGDGKENWEMGS